MTITGFKVEAGTEAIFVNWETASEIGNLGFYVLRSQSASGTYERLPLGMPSDQFIPSDDFGVGAFYEFVDVQVTPGIRYYYKVQDLPASGGGETVGPESAMIPLPATATPTVGPPTPAPTLAPAQPTATLPATVRFWADPETVGAGDCATLLWRADQVRAVFFDGTPVTGQGAQVVCPCEPATHVLRVEYRDGRFEDFTLRIGVTGTCSGTGTGSSAPATPTVVPTLQQTHTLAPTSAPGDPELPTPSPTWTTVAVQVQTPEPVSPIPTPMPSLDGVEGVPVSVDGYGDTEDRTPTATNQLSGPVEAQRSSSPPLAIAGLLLVAALGTGMVGGGIWLWKRG